MLSSNLFYEYQKTHNMHEGNPQPIKGSSPAKMGKSLLNITGDHSVIQCFIVVSLDCLVQFTNLPRLFYYYCIFSWYNIIKHNDIEHIILKGIIELMALAEEQGNKIACVPN